MMAGWHRHPGQGTALVSPARSTAVLSQPVPPPLSTLDLRIAPPGTRCRPSAGSGSARSRTRSSSSGCHRGGRRDTAGVRHNQRICTQKPVDLRGRRGQIIGDIERISGCRRRLVSRRVVTCCDRLPRLTLGFRSTAGTRNRPSPPGLSPARRCPMTTAIPSTALATIKPIFTDSERLALAGFLAGYRSLTREAYALDLRQFTTWCRARSLNLFAVRRADVESFARDLEARGRARATVTRRLCTIAGFYKYAVEEELLEHSPAAHVRRPRLDYESHATALDGNELGALLVAAGLGPPAEHALISLLALNGLRVSEATGADIEHLGLERGHRTLTITRKGGKVVTIPLAPRTARAIDLAIGERTDRPVFLAADGRRLDRHGAGRMVRTVARQAGIAKAVTPHTL